MPAVSKSPPIAAASKTLIGTSGWMYDGWRGPFYPGNLPKREWLAYYATQFATAEINSAFYRTPSLEAVRSWRNATPHDFRFAWKASKFITHWKRLTDKCENSIALMQTRLKMLNPKISVVLFQLPPQFSKNADRLKSFLQLLPRRRCYAFEFRHRSWYEDEVFDILRSRNVALCISDHADAPASWVVTAHHVYLRGHGPAGDYGGSYPGPTLRRWCNAISDWQSQARDVYVYFDNDQKGRGAGRCAALGRAADRLNAARSQKGPQGRSRGAVADTLYAMMLCAVSTSIDYTRRFDTVSHDRTLAVGARGAMA